MILPPLPKPAAYNAFDYTEAQMRQLQRDTVEACAEIAEQYEEGSGGHQAIRAMLKEIK